LAVAVKGELKAKVFWTTRQWSASQTSKVPSWGL